MRKPFIAGNWKMNLSCREAKALAEEIRQGVKGVTDREIALYPTFVSVTDLVRALEGSNVKVGGQNCSTDDNGALTGEVSASILESTGATSVIVGHSERRHILGESDAIVNKKLSKALAHRLSPILCVGEKIEEREAGTTAAVLDRQVRGGLAQIPKDAMARVTIAYEPVWAIGTGKTATPEIAEEAHAGIRKLVAELYDKAVAEDLRILYGGSVKPSNIDDLMAMPDIDGALVGGASLEAASFIRLVKFEQRR